MIFDKKQIKLDTTFENDQRNFLNFRQLLGGKNFHDKIVTKNDETTNSKVKKTK